MFQSLSAEFRRPRIALAIAGVSGYQKEIRLDLEPTIETDLGPIRYPRPITVRRTEGS